VTASRIVVLTGAGISAESGIRTFRAADGLWEDHRIEDVASPEGFARNPALVHAFYDARRLAARHAEPNAAHRALADLEQALGDEVVIITQNVDDLHERAGSRNVIHIHGELARARCTSCGARPRWTEDLAPEPPCPVCGERSLRPDVVWFGEHVHHLDEIYAVVEGCREFWVVGTSSQVAPASTLHAVAAAVGARTALLNLEAHDDVTLYDDVVLGPASEIVPDRVRRVLGAAADTS
jgi:NAD-dependent deacetylase